MKFLQHVPIVRSLFKQQLLLPVVMLLVVAGVLFEGTLDRSRPAEAVEEPSFDEPVARPVVRADLEKTPLTYFSDYWNQLAEQARPNLTSVGSSRTTAVLVGPRLALTTLEPALEVLAAQKRDRLTRPAPADAAGGEPEAVQQDDARDGTVDNPAATAAAVPGADTEAAFEAVAQPGAPVEEGEGHRLRSWNAEVGLAVFDVLGPGQTAFTLSDPRTLPSGAYLGAVTLDATGRSTVTPGYLVTAASAADGGDLVVSMDLPETLSIAAIVNLDGSLVGVAYAGPDGPRVLTSTAMLGLLEALQDRTVCRGIEVSDVTDDVRGLLPVESGVLVEFVDGDAFEPRATLRGGDVLLEWGGEEIQSVEQFVQLYDGQEPGSLVSYRVLRGRRRVTGGVVMHGADCRPVAPEPIRLPRLGLAAQWIPEQGDDDATSPSWMVVAVAPGGAAAAAGVEEHDRIVALDGRTLEQEQDRGALLSAADSEAPLLLTLLRDGRTKLAAVLPPSDVPETDTPVAASVASGDR